jgi:hypothetical protein
MATAQYLTPWVGTGESLEDQRRPALLDVPGDKIFSDVTGQPAENLIPEPNLYVAQIEATDEVLDAIVAAGFTELWRE